MDRRAFLRGVVAAAAAKLPLPVLPAPPSPASAPDGLLRGELGVWEGVRFHRGNGDGPEGCLTLADVERIKDSALKSAVPSYLLTDGPVYAMVIPPLNDWFIALRDGDVRN